ncbi:MAG: HD domain-containing protein [Deltaproteobacteria bacterium]|nr:HD domain-containing protein [Deltaproteobacteria bacterium]
MSGPQAGTTFEFHDRVTLGRRPENKLSLRDEHISRFHAIIERRGPQWVLEDLSGKGRTTVDGHAVEGTVVLLDHARIVLGRTILRFRSSVEAAVEHDVQTLPEAPIFGGVAGLPLPERQTSAPGHMRTVPVDDRLGDALESQDLEVMRQASAHLRTLLTAHAIISAELDLEKLFERILDALFETFGAHRAVVLTAENDELAVRATRLERGAQPHGEPQISSTIAYRAFRERVGVLTLDAGVDTRFDAHRSIVDQDIRSAICAPLMHRDEVLGVIYLDTIGVRCAFSEDHLRLLHGIASAAAGAVKNARLVARLKDTAVDTVFRLAVAAEHRDHDTGYHLHRMSEYAAAIARALGLGEVYAETIRLAAPMHDVGKIGIPDAILKKPGRLTEAEYEIMKQHTVKGGEILAGAQSELLQMAQNIALTHHEKFDGLGYPYGLGGEEIPLEGRIVAVADVFDAILSRRCYKPAFALEKALDILEQGRGRHFDPKVVDAFMDAQEEILQIRDRYQRLEVDGVDEGEDPVIQRMSLFRTSPFLTPG